MKRRIGGGGRREQETERGQGLHFVILCFASQRPARRLDYHVSCFVKERGIALRGLSNTVRFLSVVVSQEERYSREEESFQLTLELCLCLYN